MKSLGAIFGLIIIFLIFASCAKNQTESLWERHCAACHDGKTVLNERVVMSKEELISKFKDKALTDFMDACVGSSSCMNILKHQEKLLRDVGKEMGIGYARGSDFNK